MHVHNVGVHGNLLQNNTLRSWDFTLQTIEHMAKDTGRARHQLEHIKVRVRLFFDDNFLAHKESSLILEKLDLRDLHEVMSGPYFDTLKDVEVEFFRDVHHDVNVDIRQKLKRIFRGILQPWSARGVVTVTWPSATPGVPMAATMHRHRPYGARVDAGSESVGHKQSSGTPNFVRNTVTVQLPPLNKSYPSAILFHGDLVKFTLRGNRSARWGACVLSLCDGFVQGSLLVVRLEGVRWEYMDRNRCL
ncbi:uncharacterized protein B0H18DRAFT_1106054 [Fomitopsis serialis]|uniref:uncharacterized protein n=1 Tax=Fomitopsis serialis TaxID=139415 RepID=UPI0020075DC6|nr:uncharacterized protein B0H18DRAFT_1106054 [Neoantrodia serialis]KAH9921163.1 hypothetical protein B0H18DRAFT_1106054 [Neoantrodia serialis]